MKFVPGLLVAPSLALAQQAVLYAATSPLCAKQAGGWLHAIALAFVVAGALCVLPAWREARRLAPADASGDDGLHAHRRLFVARIAVGVGVLATLALLALWLPLWFLSPCQN